MLRDLKLQKLMHGGQCFGLPGLDPHPAATGSRLVRVFDEGGETLHCGRPRGSLIVDHHGELEIPLAEHVRDVLEMGPDLPRYDGVLGIVGFDFYSSAVLIKPKMMRGLVLR